VNNKNTIATASLVAFLPAAALGYSLVSTFLSRLGSDQFSTMLKCLYGATLLGCAGIIFLPFAVLIFGPKAPKAEPKPVEKEAKPAKKSKDEGASEELESGSESEASFDDLGSEAELSDEALVESGGRGSTGELEVVEGGMTHDDLDAVDAPFSDGELKVPEEDFFTDEDEEPPTPKKKKK